MVINNMACIYRHIRLDTNEVFYIGIGKSSDRAYDKRYRNNYWNNIVNKTEYEVQVLKKGLSWEDACELEKVLILYYGRKDLGTGILVNMTDGGEGKCNYVASDSFRSKCSDRMVGNTINNGRKHSNEINSKKGKKMGDNIKAQPIEYKGELFSCKKEMWLKHFQNISYDYMTYLIRKNKIKLN